MIMLCWVFFVVVFFKLIRTPGPIEMMFYPELDEYKTVKAFTYVKNRVSYIGLPTLVLRFFFDGLILEGIRIKIAVYNEMNLIIIALSMVSDSGCD